MYKIIFFKKIILAIFICLSFIGCTDLSAVRKWSKTSLEATQYNQLIATYVDTPKRLERYNESDRLDKNSAIREDQGKALKEIISVITDYMEALSILSSDKIISYGKQLDTFKSNIISLNEEIGNDNMRVSSNELSSASALVEMLLKAAAETYQAEQVALIVEQANPAIQQLLAKDGFLYQIIDLDFRRDLDIEDTAIEIFYSNLSDNDNEAAQQAIAEWKELRIKNNAKRKQAVDAYLKVLDKISEGHQALYKNIDELDNIELVKQLIQLVSELRTQIKLLAKN